ncbi:Mediator of RNA polymerase II transcription subunit 12 [Trichoderma ghanense]|uniref:Mediator of RNA polymerase II transcription subunit 12 n=1 Tax=Trichoderma ghanense TaxID=65468 RepID=A0ABY2GTA8_9HYPO
MTSRTPIGVHPRPPQRALSSSTLPSVQRPPPQQRALSQQLFPPSPIRKDSILSDASSDSFDPAQAQSHGANQVQAHGRLVTTPRRVGSRLRLELSNIDPVVGSAASASLSTSASASVSAASSPQSHTTSRVPSMADAADVGDSSPAPSRASAAEVDNDNQPLPMPRRRPPTSQTYPELSRRLAAPSRAAPALKKDGRPRPWTVEVPKSAPRYPSTEKRSNPTGGDPFSRGLFSGHADFFPWHGGNGKHHEDDWSPEAIQKGTWDRGNQNETSSARMTISPAIKQKSGLSALSTIFMGVLNQRRHRGHVTAPSTFKPPPRVTLTDTKREVWMKDLANPAISLRRLSRTIPHGIRGRTLLDQCLNKSVPTERAVWLAKCVGANEIRAFKRKGAPGGAFAIAGEFKWIRDWTVFVEQFIESVTSAFGEPDWKAKVTYAIRLATHLYAEQLLDRDHYLDWITSGLEHSPQSKIPMWILIAQICWADILRSRKHGRRLVYSILGHLHTVHIHPDKDILIQLSSQLSTLLASLIRNNPDSFIDPGLWPKYKDALEAFLPRDDKVGREAYHHVSARNGQVSITTTASPAAGRPQLVRLLDATLLGQIDRDLPQKCWATGDDKVDIVRTTVDWATSFYRPGLARLYVAANLIKVWSTLRINVTATILEHMDTIPAGDGARKQMVYHLVTELVRTGQFLVSQYLQWLVARGACSHPSEIDSDDAPCTTRLLVHLPIRYLTEDQKDGRANLLRRAANYSTAEEASDISNSLMCVSHTLGLPVQGDAMAGRRPIPLRKLLPRILSSSKALQTAVGLHLRETVLRLVKSVQPISLRMFSAIRTILEATQDFYALCDVLKLCSRTTNIEVLASCVDTVNLHLLVFYAQGGAERLFTIFFERLKAINQEQGLVSRPLLAALCFLSRRMPSRQELSKYLAHELTQSDRNNATDACSPISDNMVNPPSGADGEVSEQIEKLLASGNSIDHPTMNRLFGYIIRRLEAGWAKMDDNRRVHASLLTRLRLFDAQHFDKLMSDWVGRVRLLKSRQRLDAVFPLLIITDALPVSFLVGPASLTQAPPSGDAEAAAATVPDLATPGAVTYLQELLHLILSRLPADSDLSQEEAYRFGIYQRALQLNHYKGLLSLIRHAAVEYADLRARVGNAKLPLDDGTYRESVLDALRLLVVVHTADVTDAFSPKNIPPAGFRLIHEMISNLFQQEGHLGTPSAAAYDEILRLTNELTMPFCQIKLNMDLSISPPRPTEGEDGQPQPSSSQFDLFAKAMDRAIEAQNIMWTTMLPCLSEDISRHLQSQARSRFLALVPTSSSFSSSKAPSNRQNAPANSSNLYLAEKLLGVIEAIVVGQPPPNTAQLNSVVADRLSDLVEIVVAPKDREDKTEGMLVPIIEHWLPMLLKFVLLHSVSLEPLSASVMTTSAQGKLVMPPHHEARAHTVLALCRLFLALEALPSQLVGGGLRQQVFDVTTVLADGLPDDLRLHCAKSILLLPGTMPTLRTSSDARLHYILSVPQMSSMDALMLAHREKTATPPSTAARGMGAMYGIGPASQERLSPFVLRRWELLSEPTPNVGVNDTSLSLSLFEAIRLH